MTVNQIFPEQYQNQLDDKIVRLEELFAGFETPQMQVFESPKANYRMRAEFKIWHENGRAHYAMYKQGEYKRPFIIDDFPVATAQINQLMPLLLEKVNNSELLSRRLFQAEFLNTLTGQTVITLIYHKPLCDQWQAEAEQLASDLGVHLIGRSRKQKRVIGQDYVEETLTVHDRNYHYQQVEASFTQPNAKICEKMLEWALDSVATTNRDLLELYCGNGNFTIPLASRFRKVVATEISKTSVKSAHYNLEKNQIDNVDILRMSSEEFSEAMDGVREFRRLKEINLDEYDFSTVLVDPPRAGLDDHTVQIVSRFDQIIYISCNPETLKNNLEALSQTHDIQQFALFDQFPYTHHMECGMVLNKKS
ncbi:MAG: tRNA (uridine(54)-C5)-methyltransferase TrmA [Candidatus Pelagadaptatus aseana]|uniref:tRNA (uridine(54)-C5)-methyltransferase TrmA n=1 Tax=Candidatus Pelagadaptatus aseana TaxID=3120508 RepID=UPI0039B256D7